MSLSRPVHKFFSGILLSDDSGYGKLSRNPDISRGSFYGKTVRGICSEVAVGIILVVSGICERNIGVDIAGHYGSFNLIGGFLTQTNFDVARSGADCHVTG